MSDLYQPHLPEEVEAYEQAIKHIIEIMQLREDAYKANEQPLKMKTIKLMKDDIIMMFETGWSNGHE